VSRATSADRLRGTWPLFFFIVLFGIFCWPYLFLQKTFFYGDYALQHFPWARLLFDCVRAGRIPIYTDGIGCGFPIFAESQTGCLYVPQVVLYRILPFLTAYTWLVPIHLALAGVGFFLLMKKTGASSAASWLGSTCWVFGSSYAGCFINVPTLKALAWTPWVLWLLEGARISRPKRFLNFFLLASVFFLQMVAGSPQMAVYAAVFYVCYELFGLPPRRRERSCFLFLTGGLLLGMMLALPQWIATSELIRASTRQGESAAFALWGSVLPPAGASLFYPAWGNIFRVSFYIGIAPLFLICALFFATGKTFSRRLFWTALLFFVLALGKYNPFYRYAVEWLNVTFLRNPSKLLFFSLFSMAALAGNGLDAVISMPVRRRERYARWAAALTGFASMLPFFGQAVLHQMKSVWPQISQGWAAKIVSEKGDWARSPDHYRAILENALSRLSELFSYGNPETLRTVALAFAAFAILFFYLRGRFSKPLFLFLLSAALAADLYGFGVARGIGFVGNERPMAEAAQTPPAIEKFKQLADGRMAAEIAPEPLEVCPPNLNLRYGILSPGVYSPLLIKRYHELCLDLGLTDASLGRKDPNPEVWQRMRGLVDMLGITLIRSSRPLNWPELEERGRGYWENQRALPEMVGYSNWRVIRDPAERLAFLKSEAFDPRRLAVLEEDPGGEPSPGDKPVFGVKKGATDTARVYGLSMSRPGVVFIRLARYPGWSVEIDGVSQKQLTVNHAFLGFRVPRGDRLILVRYQPVWWKQIKPLWVLISALVLLAMALSFFKAVNVSASFMWFLWGVVVWIVYLGTYFYSKLKGPPWSS